MAKNADVVYKLGLDNKDFDRSINSSIQSVGKFAGGLVSLAGGTAIISSLGSSAVQMGMDFDESFAKVSTLFGDVAVDTEDLTFMIMNLSNTTGIAASEISEGLYQALSAGIPVTEDMTEAMNFMIQATELSIAGFTSLPKAVDVATTVINAFGLSVDDTNKVMNTLIETQNAGKTTVDELASSLGNAIPSAAQLGISFEELSASVAVLTANGIGTAESMTQLKALFNELIDPASAVNDVFKEITEQTFPEFIEAGGTLNEGLEILNQYLQENNKSWGEILTSSESVSAAFTLMKDGGEKLDEVLARMTDDTYELSEGYEKMQTPAMQVAKIQQSWNNLLIAFWEKISPKVTEALTYIADSMYILGPIILVLVVGLGLLAIGFGIASIAGLVLSVVLSPIFLIAVAVAGGIVLLILVLVKLEQAFGFVSKSIAFFSENILKPLVTTVKDVAMQIYTAFNQMFKQLAEIGRAFWKEYGDEITWFWQNICIPFLEFFSNVFVSTIASALQYIGDVFEKTFTFIANMVESLTNILGGFIDFIAGVFTGDWERAWNGILSIFKGWANGIISVFNFVLNSATSFANFFVRIINSAVDGVVGMLNHIPFINIPLEWGIPEVPSFQIPYFAKGGIVNGATLGVVGEAGPEMILPLNGQGANFINSLIGNGAGSSESVVFQNTFNIQGENSKDIADEINIALGNLLNKKGLI